jgi:hypothetical protein
MQIILKELCWGFGKTESKFQRRFRIANRSVAFLAILYSGLAFFPQLLFAHSYSYANYTIHSNTPLGPESDQVLKRADALLKRSDLYSRDSHHDIFLCNNNALYNLFSLRNGKKPTPSPPPPGKFSSSTDPCRTTSAGRLTRPPKFAQ